MATGPDCWKRCEAAPLIWRSFRPRECDDLDRNAREWIADALRRAQAPEESGDLLGLRGLVRQQLVPRLSQCGAELRNLIAGLGGKFVPPGPAGAPTRGRLDVLPTGRNFFAIDPASGSNANLVALWQSDGRSAA